MEGLGDGMNASVNVPVSLQPWVSLWVHRKRMGEWPGQSSSWLGKHTHSHQALGLLEFNAVRELR